MKIVTLNFKGYFFDETSKTNFPGHEGIYCVYRGTLSEDKKSCSLKELLYIGESDNLKNRIISHEKWEEWKLQLNKGESLFFSYALTDSYREEIEKVLIYHKKPRCNTKNIQSYNVTSLQIEITGQHKDLDDTYEA